MRELLRTVLVAGFALLCVVPASVSSPSASVPDTPFALPVAPTAAVGTTVPISGFDWPLRPPPRVSRPFQPPYQPYGPGHRGADLAGVRGRPVLSAGAGVVVYAGPLAGRGVVSVQHAGGLRTSYEPLRATVRPGQLVGPGQPLGLLAGGHPGCPVPACLHWGLRRDGDYLDPLLLVRARHVRLLPWPARG